MRSPCWLRFCITVSTSSPPLSTEGSRLWCRCAGLGAGPAGVHHGPEGPGEARGQAVYGALHRQPRGRLPPDAPVRGHLWLPQRQEEQEWQTAPALRMRANVHDRRAGAQGCLLEPIAAEKKRVVPATQAVWAGRTECPLEAASLGSGFMSQKLCICCGSPAVLAATLSWLSRSLARGAVCFPGRPLHP